jgi:Leucine-rich repeat (LRR) protein
MTIKNLPGPLNRFTNLKYLNLSGLRKHWLNRREEPIAFGNLKELVYLDLSRCSGVHGVLDTLCSLTKLQYLNLSGCSCFDACTELYPSRMSEAIGNLTELHYLNLSHCSGTQEHPKQAFFVFLECIGNLLNLEHLDLSSNESLMSLPDSFRSLKKLHTLDILDCMNLQGLPSFINEMDRLKFLDLNGCLIDMLKQGHLNKNLVVLPYFVVHSDSHDSGSNLFLINDVNRTDLVISRLENIKSVQEAQSIKLAGKD